MSSIHLAVALDGAGWHPAAARDTDEALRPRYRLDQVQRAEAGLLDFVTIAGRW